MIFGSNLYGQGNKESLDYVKGYTKSNFRLEYINLIPTDSFAVVSKPTWVKLFESYRLLNKSDTIISAYKLTTNKQIDSLYSQIDLFKKKVAIQDEKEKEHKQQIAIRDIVIDNKNLEINNVNTIVEDKNKIIIKQDKQLGNVKWFVGGAGLLGFIIGVWVVK